MRSIELCRLALGSVRRTPLRVALTVVGVVIASGALVTMLAFGIGVQRAIEKPFHQLDLASRIEVRMPGDAGDRRGPPGSGPPDQPESAAEDNDTVTPPPLDRAAVAAFGEIRGVRLAYPEVRVEHVKLFVGDKDASTTVLGAPPGLGEFTFVKEALVAGQFVTAPNADEIVLGAGLLDQLGFDDPQSAIGQTVKVVSRGLVPDDDGNMSWSQTDTNATVVGVMKGLGIGSRMGRNNALLPITTAESLPGAQYRNVMRQFESDTAPVEGYRSVVVRVAGVSQLNSVEDKIKTLGYRTSNPLTNIKQLRTAFLVFDSLLAMVGAVALLIASLGIVNTQLMSVLERTKEIAIYKAIGASNGDVRTIFLAEAAVVGVLGGVGGILLAVGTSKLFGFIVNMYMRSQGIDEAVVLFSFPMWLLGAAIGFTIIISLISGLYPATRAAKVDPIIALRGQ